MQKDGYTLRHHLEAAWRASGRRPGELDGPDCPPAAAHLWQWFLDIARSRRRDRAGPAPLAWSEIAAWAQLHRLHLAPRELTLLMRIDNAYLQAQTAR